MAKRFPEVRVSRYAMRARFEIVLYGAGKERLRAAGEGALDEVERWEERLSVYRPESDISGINAYAAKRPVKLEPRVFRCLQTANRIWQQTDGAFDITVGPLLRAWGFVSGVGHVPQPETLEKALAVTGMQHVHLDDDALTVEFDEQGVEIDLGAIGKGVAIESAAEFLLECGVKNALLHGGTSSVYAIGKSPGSDGWSVALQHPKEPESQLTVISLSDSSLSVSAPHGKSFVVDNQVLGHVLDPRSGLPAMTGLLAAVIGPSSTETDAYSTGLLVSGAEGISLLSDKRPDLSLLVAAQGADSDIQIDSCGNVWGL